MSLIKNLKIRSKLPKLTSTPTPPSAYVWDEIQGESYRSHNAPWKVYVFDPPFWTMDFTAHMSK